MPYTIILHLLGAKIRSQLIVAQNLIDGLGKVTRPGDQFKAGSAAFRSGLVLAVGSAFRRDAEALAELLGQKTGQIKAATSGTQRKSSNFLLTLFI